MRKSWYAISGATFGCLFLLGMAIAALAQDQTSKPDYSWLNGKWRGPERGRELDLKVGSGNQVTGTMTQTIVTGAGRKFTHIPVTGTVEGERVELTIMTANQTKLRLSYVEGMLKGKSKGEEVIYKKVE